MEMTAIDPTGPKVAIPWLRAVPNVRTGTMDVLLRLIRYPPGSFEYLRVSPR